jgi:hypothetical protein
MFIDDTVLAVLHLGEVEARIFAEDAFFVRILEVLPDVGCVEEGFGGDTTHQQAGTAEFRLSFDKGGFEAVLAGADGCGVAAGTTPNNNQIVWHFFYSTYDTAAGAGASKEKKLSAISLQLSAEDLGAPRHGTFKTYEVVAYIDAGLQRGIRTGREACATGPAVADRQSYGGGQPVVQHRASAGSGRA